MTENEFLNAHRANGLQVLTVPENCNRVPILSGGRVIGVGERLAPAEIKRLVQKQSIQKSARDSGTNSNPSRSPATAGDPNSVFDSLFPFGPSASEVQKTADSNSEILEGIFPPWLRTT
ncbi:hypothetical protein UC8_41080 [Roseimaritima ulvae]|uniref:Uncharacterized protein n=1 Tax=Roseimaritima ulvae TaxID=980254 RepID=A0A5B9QSN5_9BACT|nr:hypothetical protein UC8_41080 [Roseimaritima ulvae]